MKLSNQAIFDAKETLQALKLEDWPAQVDYGLGKMIGRLNQALDNIEELRDRLIEKQTVHPEGAAKFEADIADMLNRGEFDAGHFVAITLPAEVGGEPLELDPSTLADLVSLGLVME